MRWAAALALLVVLTLVLSVVVLFPAAKRMADRITIAIQERPQPSGPFSVANTVLKFPLPASSNVDAVFGLVDVWYPIDETHPLYVGSRSRSMTGMAGAVAGVISSKVHATVPKVLPVLFYAPGWDGPRGDNVIAATNLASHGYVVVAVDDVGQDRMLNVDWHEGVEPAASAGFDMSSEAALNKSVSIAERRLRLMTDKLSYVLDGLGNAPGRMLQDKIRRDLLLDRVGMFGFSFGGSVAAEITHTDDRFVAVANMDGWMFGESARRGVARPYLIFNSDYPDIVRHSKSKSFRKRSMALMTFADRKVQTKQVSRPSSVSLFFKRVEHVDFTDTLFTPSLKSYLKFWRRTSSDRLRLRKIMDAYLLSFFDRYLRDVATGNDLITRPARFPEVSVLRPEGNA